MPDILPFCRSFFRPAGRKNDLQKGKISGMRKPPSRRKAAEVSLLTPS